MKRVAGMKSRFNKSQTVTPLDLLRRQGKTRCAILLVYIYSSRKEQLLPAFFYALQDVSFTWDFSGTHTPEST